VKSGSTQSARRANCCGKPRRRRGYWGARRPRRRRGRWAVDRLCPRAWENTSCDVNGSVCFPAVTVETPAGGSALAS
jgi:hypothetical protein